MTSAWIMFVCGCLIMSQGAWSSRIRGGSQPPSLQTAMGRILFGAGLAIDGVPRIAGWSAGTGATVAGIGFALVVLGGVLWIRGSRKPKRARLPDDIR